MQHTAHWMFSHFSTSSDYSVTSSELSYKCNRSCL